MRARRPDKYLAADWAPPFLQTLPKHYFDSAEDGELKGSQVANIVRARGNLRTVTAAAPMTKGALVSVAVRGMSHVEVEMDPDIFIMRFGVGGRFRYETDDQSSGHSREILLSPGTHFATHGQDESSLLFALHRSALATALGTDRPKISGIHSLPRQQGSSLRQIAFGSARTYEQLSDKLRPRFLANLQNLMASGMARLIGTLLPDIRQADPMIGRRKVADLREWASVDRADPLTVGDLAERCGLGRRALQKNFLRHFDTTPAEFLRGLRLQRARKLILGGAFTVTHAALEAGFVHLGHLLQITKRRLANFPPSPPRVPPANTLRVRTRASALDSKGAWFRYHDPIRDSGGGSRAPMGCTPDSRLRRGCLQNV